MKALFYDGAVKPSPDYPPPKPPPGEALIRLSLAGICNTDLEIAKGYMGFQGCWATSSWPLRPGIGTPEEAPSRCGLSY